MEISVKISIIIATYNSSRTLKRCLDSIVEQYDEDCEIIVIDGGSKDGTNDIIKSFSPYISYTVSEKDKGVYDAWNKGLKVAKGEWITFIGSDDFMASDTMKMYKAVLEKGSMDYDLICGKIHYVNKEGIIIRDIGEPFDWSKLVHRSLKLAHPGLLHNRRCFDKYGYFDTRYKICADSDFLQRLGPDVKTLFINNFFVYMTEGGISDSYNAIVESFLIRYRNGNLNLFENLIGFFKSLIVMLIKKTKRKFS